MCLSLSCHAEGDLRSKGRKVRVYLLKATLPLLQKNKHRPQTHHYKASHRGDRPKLKQRFFSLYTSFTSVCVQANLPSWKVQIYQLWMLKSVQARSKTSISKALYKRTLSLPQKRSFGGSDMLPFPCLLLPHLSAKPVHKSNIQSDEFLPTKRSLTHLMESLNSYMVTGFNY